MNPESNTEFKKTRWMEADFVQDYLRDSDIYIPQRKLVLQIMKLLYKQFLGKDIINPHVIDLGCGDGILTQTFLSIDPTIKATLVDGSKTMLEQAVKNTNKKNVKRSVLSSFQELHKIKNIEKADFIISSLAIHHLKRSEKKKLYEFIFKKLKKGGVFLNFDAVLSSSDIMEEFDLLLWKYWIVNNQDIGIKQKKPSLEYIPNQYKENKDNIPSSIEDQLKMLKNIGFKDVNIFYKYGLFSLFGGFKK